MIDFILRRTTTFQKTIVIYFDVSPFQTIAWSQMKTITFNTPQLSKKRNEKKEKGLSSQLPGWSRKFLFFKKKLLLARENLLSGVGTKGNTIISCNPK